MLKRMHSILLTLLIGLAALPAFAGVASGPVYFHGAYDTYSYAPNGSYVKFCDIAYDPQLMGVGRCYLTTTYNGTYSISLPDYRSYDFFTWYDPNDWGSSSTNAWTGDTGTYANVLNLAPTGAYFSMISELRPHKPSAVYPPNGATNVPLAFTLTWSSGIDSARNWPGVWNVTYDVYGYGEGGTEIKDLADVPCNPNAQGNCTYFINNVLPGVHYFWRVVPKIHVPQGSRIYSQSSQEFTFTTQP